MVTNWKVVLDEGPAVTLVPIRKIAGLLPENGEFIGLHIGQSYSCNFIVAGSIGFGPERYSLNFDGGICKVLNHLHSEVLSYGRKEENLKAAKIALGLAKSLCGSERLIPAKIGVSIEDLVKAWEIYVADCEKEMEG